MNVSHLRLLLLGIVLLVGTSTAVAQQVPDPNFDVKVAKPAYTAKGPKVLVDEAHFNFHTAGGRYKPLADLLRNDGYQVAPNTAKFTKEALTGCDILLISNALGAERMGSAEASNPAFTEEECAAVAEWVKNGGSLLLIADHAPMGAAAQTLGKRFGVDMHTGHTIDPEHADKRMNNPGCLAFTQENKLLGEHPIIKGREAGEALKTVTTFTGQSLKGPEGSVAFLKLSDTAVDVNPTNRKQTSAAGRAQGIAFTFGKGRVVVLGEAACLSAQLAGPQQRPMGMNFPGLDNKQLALNILHWLSGLLT